MSEITRGVIGMPFDMAMSSELSRRQFHQIAQALLVERDALEATVAQQAKMIEHLRGGLGKEPQLLSYAEDMSTCTLTTGDGTGYFYDRVDPDQPSQYTAIYMANAARDGFRDGAASVQRLPDRLREVWLFLDGQTELNGCVFGEKPEGRHQFWWRKELREAIESLEATGGSVKE